MPKKGLFRHSASMQYFGQKSELDELDAGEHAEVSVVSVTSFRDYKVSWTWMLTAFAIA